MVTFTTTTMLEKTKLLGLLLTILLCGQARSQIEAGPGVPAGAPGVAPAGAPEQRQAPQPGFQNRFQFQPPPQQFPQVPCPASFRYVANGQSPTYGEVMASIPPHATGIYELEVNMTVAAPVHQNDGLKISVLSSQQEILSGGPIRYAIHFPPSAGGAIPWLTQLQFNGQVFCTGRSPSLNEGSVQSAMWAKSTITARPTGGGPGGMESGWPTKSPWDSIHTTNNWGGGGIGNGIINGGGIGGGDWGTGHWPTTTQNPWISTGSQIWGFTDYTPFPPNNWGMARKDEGQGGGPSPQQADGGYAGPGQK